MEATADIGDPTVLHAVLSTLLLASASGVLTISAQVRLTTRHRVPGDCENGGSAAESVERQPRQFLTREREKNVLI